MDSVHRDQSPYVGLSVRAKLSFMTYLLEYVTGHSVGRAAIDCGTFHQALAKAEQALKGLPCISGVLRYASVPNPSFGDGLALACFTPVDGWRLEERQLPKGLFSCKG
jgi:hypothetical protein